MFGKVGGNSEGTRFGLQQICWLFVGRPRLCFAVYRISPLQNYHECFRAYFARGTILQAALLYRLHSTVFLLLYDLSLESKNSLLLNDLSLKRKNFFVAI